MYKAALSFKFTTAPLKPQPKALKTPVHKPVRRAKDLNKSSTLKIFLRSANA
jgi:hypothetical protein